MVIAKYLLYFRLVSKRSCNNSVFAMKAVFCQNVFPRNVAQLEIKRMTV